MSTGGDRSERILVLAPVGRDAELLVRAAAERGLVAMAYQAVDPFCVAFRAGCGAALLTEEALYLDREGKMRTAVDEQPTWSEVPFVVLTGRGQADERVSLTLGLMQPLRNVTVLERPVRPATIVSALEAALRDRRRQYEVREALEALRVANQNLESRIERRTAELLAKVTELEGFTYSISHDMRSPLRSMVSNAAIVLEEQGERLNEDGREGLQRISTAALKMARLIDDLLQFARLGGAEPRREFCDITDLAERVATEVAHDIAPVESEITVAPGLVANGDPLLLGLVLHNLIENACKYRKAGAVPKVHVGKKDGAFFVRDDGIGFDPQFAAKLFGVFERLHRDSDYPGTGIGLANVKRVVERHGGRVWAESSPGEGATFYFTLG